MSLVIWLPLNKDLRNNGTSNISITNNGATINDNGKIGKCYYFNGSSQYLQFSESLSNLYCGDFSWALWAKPTDDTRGILISEYSSTGASNVALELLANRSIRVYWNGSPDWNTGKSIPLNTWSHIAVTRHVNTLTVYVNGEQVAIKSDATLANRTSSSKIRIGDDYRGGTSVSYMGYLNDVRIYDHCLSPKEIKEIASGLVLHYKLDDPYTEATTNLHTSEDSLSSTCYNGAINKYSYGTTTDMYKTTGTFQGKFCTKVYMGTSGNSAYPYVYLSNIYVSNGTNSPEYKTISFDYFGTIGDKLIPYKLGSGTATCDWTNDVSGTKSGTGTNSVNISVVPGIWNHITMTLHGTTDADAQWGYIRIGSAAHTSDTSNYWLFANMQIELKDHATPYTSSSRTETIVRDSSGYGYNGIITGDLTINNNTGRYSKCTNFDGNSYVTGPNFAVSMIQSASFWLFVPSTIPITGIVFLDRSSKIAFGYWSGNKIIIACTTACKSVYSNSCLVTNAWNHICIVRPTDSTEPTLYINGVLQTNDGTSDCWGGSSTEFTIGRRTTSTAYPFTGKINDFRLYSTILSEDDAKDIYNKAAFIDKANNTINFEEVECYPNITMNQDYGIKSKTWVPGLSSYTQSNCTCTLTDDGYRIYRTPNVKNQSNGGSNSMWGGFVLDNTNNRFNLQKGHTYVLQFEVKGQSSNAASDIYWTNLVGWGGGGLDAAPSNIVTDNPVVADFNSSDWQTVSYKWTISDDVYKVCTSSYSSFVQGNTYLSYKGFKFGFGYINTGSLGTDLYIRNIRIFDITTNQNTQIFKSGVIKTISFVEEDINTKISLGGLLSNQLIEK